MTDEKQTEWTKTMNLRNHKYFRKSLYTGYDAKYEIQQQEVNSEGETRWVSLPEAVTPPH